MSLHPKGIKNLINHLKKLDDKELRQLAWVYMRRQRTTVDMEIEMFIQLEIGRRRNEKEAKLDRSFWISTRRGKIVEAIKRRLVRWGVWSSAYSEKRESPNFFVSVIKIFWQVFKAFWYVCISSRNHIAPRSRNTLKRNPPKAI